MNMARVERCSGRQRKGGVVLLVLVGVVLQACRNPSAPPVGVPSVPSGTMEGSRTLVAAVRVEPDSVAARPPQGGGLAALNFTRRLLNAELTLLDERGSPGPYLAEELPELGTESWRVYSDGRMETRWRLRPGAAWHDGAPLTAADFVFAWRVYRTPGLGGSAAPPLHAMEDVIAVDDRTFVIYWHRLYPDANSLAGYDRDFVPLPHHILAVPFEQVASEAFANHPYWSREYIGLGPFRLESWEPGSFLQVVAFDRHVLGRPRIDRIEVRFKSDMNSVLASMLAGEIHLAADNALSLEQVVTLKREWEPLGAGGFILIPSLWRATAFQLRPEFANPSAILDLRVRKALAHTVDKQVLTETVYHGMEPVSDFMISPSSRWGSAAARGIVPYAYDAQRAEELMREAGFARGNDGFYRSPTGARFTAELKTTAAPNWEAEMTIMAAEWRRSGFDIQDAVLPQARAQDAEVRMTFPAMFTSTTSLGERALLLYSIAEIPRAENRWRGGNRGGWVNHEFDRLLDAFTSTLDPAERSMLVERMARIYTGDLPVIPLLFNSLPAAHVAALRGPVVTAPETLLAWNVHQWEFR